MVLSLILINNSKLQNIILLIFGGAYKEVSYLPVAEGLDVAGLVVTPVEISVVLGALIMFILMYILMQKVLKIYLSIKEPPEKLSFSAKVYKGPNKRKSRPNPPQQ